MFPIILWQLNDSSISMINQTAPLYMHIITPNSWKRLIDDDIEQRYIICLQFLYLANIYYVCCLFIFNFAVKKSPIARKGCLTFLFLKRWQLIWAFKLIMHKLYNSFQFYLFVVNFYIRFIFLRETNTNCLKINVSICIHIMF